MILRQMHSFLLFFFGNNVSVHVLSYPILVLAAHLFVIAACLVPLSSVVGNTIIGL